MNKSLASNRKDGSFIKRPLHTTTHKNNQNPLDSKMKATVPQSTISPDSKPKRQRKVMDGSIATTSTTTSMKESGEEEEELQLSTSSAIGTPPSAGLTVQAAPLFGVGGQSIVNQTPIANPLPVANLPDANPESIPNQNHVVSSIPSQQTPPPKNIGYGPNESVNYQDPPPVLLCKANYNQFRREQEEGTFFGVFMNEREAKNLSTNFQTKWWVANLAEPVTGAMFKVVLAKQLRTVQTGTVLAVSGRLRAIDRQIRQYGHEVDARNGQIAKEEDDARLSIFRRPGGFSIVGASVLTTITQPQAVSFTAKIVTRDRSGYVIAFEDTAKTYNLQYWFEDHQRSLTIGDYYRFGHACAFRVFKTDDIVFAVTEGFSTCTHVGDSTGQQQPQQAAAFIPLNLNF